MRAREVFVAWGGTLGLVSLVLGTVGAESARAEGSFFDSAIDSAGQARCPNLRLDTQGGSSIVKPEGTMAGYPAMQQYTSEMCESYAFTAFLDAYKRRQKLINNPGAPATWDTDVSAPYVTSACSKANEGIDAASQLGLVPTQYPSVFAGAKDLGGTCNLKKISGSMNEFVAKLVKDGRNSSIFGAMGKMLPEIDQATGAAKEKLIKERSLQLACNLKGYGLPMPSLDAQADSIAAVLRKSSGHDLKDKLQFICDVMKSSCIERGAFTAMNVPDMKFDTGLDAGGKPVVPGNVKKMLQSGLPVPFAVDKSALFGPSYGRGGHAMLIIGQKWVDHKCRYLVRDSNGTDCSIYQNEELHKNCGLKPEGSPAGLGNLWVDEDTLAKSSTGFWYTNP